MKVKDIEKDNGFPMDEDLNELMKRQIKKGLDLSSANYITEYPNLPEPSTICRECGADIKVFSFLNGLCIRCFISCKRCENLTEYGCSIEGIDEILSNHKLCPVFKLKEGAD